MGIGKDNFCVCILPCRALNGTFGAEICSLTSPLEGALRGCTSS